MSDAAKPPPTLALVPKVRVAMHLLVNTGPNAKVAKVTVLEMRDGLSLGLDTDNSGIGVKEVPLSLTEAAKLGEHLRLMAARVRERARRGRP